MDDKLRDVLFRASNLAGTDLVARYNEAKEGLDIVSRQNATERIEKIRTSLPNQKARKRFDKEMREQAKRTTAEKASQRAYRFSRSNRRMLARLERRLRESGIKDPAPVVIPAHLWKQTQHILADPTGWASKYYSRLCWHRIATSIIHRAALDFDEQNKPRYSYIGNSRESQRARHVLAIGLLIVGLAKETGRRRHGWMRLVSGIPQLAFLAALRDPFTGRRPSASALNGTHRDSDSAGDLGYLTSLYRAGLCYSRQAKWKAGDDPKKLKGWSDIKPEEMPANVKTGGWLVSLNRYWLVADRFTDPIDAAKRAELYVAWLSGAAYPEIVDFETFESTSNTEQTSESREAPS